MAHHFDNHAADFKSLVEVDPGFHPHFPAHVQKVFGRDVSGRSGDKGAAPYPRKSGVEACETGLHPCKYIGKSESACVMEMKPPDDLRKLLCHLGTETENLCGTGNPGRI